MGTVATGARRALSVLVHGRLLAAGGGAAEAEATEAALGALSRRLHEAEPGGVRAAFAFREDAAAWRTVLWCSDAAAALRAGVAARGCAGAAPLPALVVAREPLQVYGGWRDNGVEEAVAVSGVRCEFHAPLAGFMRLGSGAVDAGPPLIGFTRRRVRAGEVGQLAAKFQTVCDLWFERVPGMLAATVSADHSEPDVVHDIRIFADFAAYTQHADKSDDELTAAMEAWFAHYDTSVPFTGELYAPDTRDERMHTSSIQPATTPRAQLATFHYSSGLIGVLPRL